MHVYIKSCVYVCVYIYIYVVCTYRRTYKQLFGHTHMRDASGTSPNSDNTAPGRPGRAWRPSRSTTDYHDRNNQDQQKKYKTITLKPPRDSMSRPRGYHSQAASPKSGGIPTQCSPEHWRDSGHGACVSPPKQVAVSRTANIQSHKYRRDSEFSRPTRWPVHWTLP